MSIVRGLSFNQKVSSKGKITYIVVNKGLNLINHSELVVGIDRRDGNLK